MTEITIAGRKVGTGHPVLIVAELSGNHNGDYSTAEALVRAAAEAGADMVKSQCFEPGDMTLPRATPPFCLTWNREKRTLWDLYSETAMPVSWHSGLKTLAESLGMAYFFSVFSDGGIRLGEHIGIPAYKIASFELTDLPLIRAAARTGKPLILSTGMATIEEIRAALIAQDEGTWQYLGIPSDALVKLSSKAVLLKCTSAYPAPLAEANLRTLGTEWVPHFWSSTYPVGLSDHSRSNAAVCAAVALGACVVERHLKLGDCFGSDYYIDISPDAAFSDAPDEFAAMVRAIRETEAALGTVHYGPTESERPMLRFRRSLWVVADIAAGEMLTPENVRCLRPADGLEPKHYDAVMGRRAKGAIERGTPLPSELMEG